MRPEATPQERQRRYLDRGSISLELVAAFLPFLFLAMWAVADALNMNEAKSGAYTTARSAARAASIELDPSRARAAAETAAAASLPSSCLDPVVEVDLDGFEPGGTVSATVWCTFDPVLVPADRFSKTAWSPIDQWRVEAQ